MVITGSAFPKEKFRLGSHTAYIKEKWEYVEDEL